MNPIQAAVDRPYTVAVGVILTVLFSILAVRRIPVQLKPTVDEPRITVTTPFRGAAAIEVEEQITRELEDVLQSVEGLTELSSVSAEGSSTITLEFSPATDVQLAVVDVINQLSQVPPLPPEADESAVRIASALDNDKVMWVALRSGYGPNRIRQIVVDEIEGRISRVEGVSSLLIAGGSDREVQVRLDPEQLLARGVSFQEVSDALARGNVNVRGGTVETRERRWIVRTLGRAPEAEKLETLIVRESEFGSVRLGDVATVVDGFREVEGFVSISGNPGVALGVGRESGANVVQVIRDLDAAIDELNGAFHVRGIDLELVPLFRETSYIQAALDFVIDNLVLGAALAIGVLVIFLRSVRSVLIVSLSIPISLVAVFLVLESSGRTINVISLAGIAFASGMVVDNAIVVLENIFRHLEMGKGARKAAIDGGREVWGGVLASTLTTVAVFLPILQEHDEASQLFRDIAIGISAAVLISLVVALTVVPVLASVLMRLGEGKPEANGDAAAPRLAAQGADATEPTPLGPIGRVYGRWMDRLASRWPGSLLAKTGAVLLVAAAAVWTLSLTPSAEYLPSGNRNLILFFADPIPGTRPEAIKKNIEPLERWALAQPEVDRMFAVTGRNFNGGGIVLKEGHDTAEGLAAFHGRMFGPAMGLSGFNFCIPIRASLFNDPGKQFEVELSGPDFASLEQANAELTSGLQRMPGVTGVRSSLITGRPELQVTVDETRAKDLDLTVSDIGRVVETAVAGRRLTAMIDGGREVDVNLVVAQERIDSEEALESLRFLAPGGRPVSIGSVATVDRTTGPQSVRRLERERNVLLTVNISDDTPLQAALDRIEGDLFPPIAAGLGPAYTLRVAGTADKLKQTLGSLAGGFGLSVLIIYLLLVALFRSWFTPLVILATVPLALSGGIVGIRLASEATGGLASFDVIAMLGFIILAGLVVNNAILIVHQAGNFRREGRDPRRSLADSARSRLRPILMSVITTVSAMVPLALGGGAGAELYQGLGAVIVGGLVLSTIFTLFVVPLLLSIGLDLADVLAGLRSREPRGYPAGRVGEA